MKNILAVAVATLALGLTCRDARATHGNWVLAGSGSQCSRYNPEWNGESFSDVFSWYPFNGTTNAGITCPVSLAARWGSSGSVPFPPDRRARVMYANVYAYVAPGKTLTCKVGMRMSSNLLYWSQSRTNLASGNTRVELVNPRSNWGGTAEQHKTEDVESMDVYCDTPPGTVIRGYKVKLCQYLPAAGWNCDDNRAVDEDTDSFAGYSPIQVSGIECVAQNNYGDLRRSENGMKNMKSVFDGEEWVWCPITPPADHGYRHSRRMTTTRVYYDASTFGNAQAGCSTWGAGGPKCPMCNVTTVDYSQNNYWGATFNYPANFPSYKYVEQPEATMLLGYDAAMSVRCLLPPLQTISGITSSVSVTRVGDGI